MGIKPDFLTDSIFSDKPINWFVHSQGFFYTGKSLIEAEKKNISPKFVNTEFIFNKQYSYKIAIYLLSHAIELLLKAIISSYNRANPSSPLKESIKYGHNAKIMFDELVNKGWILKKDDDEEVIELVDIYLKWFGRYYCPHKNDIARTLEENYIEDGNGLLEFKYKLTFDTHKKLIDFYESQIPRVFTELCQSDANKPTF